jgi:hypothetical protein
VHRLTTAGFSAAPSDAMLHSRHSTSVPRIGKRRALEWFRAAWRARRQLDADAVRAFFGVQSASKCMCVYLLHDFRPRARAAFLCCVPDVLIAARARASDCGHIRSLRAPMLRVRSPSKARDVHRSTGCNSRRNNALNWVALRGLMKLLACLAGIGLDLYMYESKWHVPKSRAQ